MSSCVAAEPGAYVRAYGPVRLRVEAGSLLGPGYTIGPGDETVVRSARGSSFLALEPSRVCYTAGAGAAVVVEKEAGVHREWLKVVEEVRSIGARRLVVLGPPEAGKSTMSLWFRNALRACLIEADVGQNELGLPGMVAASAFDGRAYPVLNDLPVSRAWFVGHVSAEKVVDTIIAAALKAARFCGDSFVVDTDGYVDGRGLIHKVNLVSALQPDAVVVMGGHHVAEQLKGLVDTVFAAPKPPKPRERDKVDRRAFRERAYAQLFARSETMVLDLNEIVLLNHEPCTVAEGAGTVVLECPSGRYVLGAARRGRGQALKRGWERGLLVGVDDGGGGEVPAVLESLDYGRSKMVLRVSRVLEPPPRPRYVVLGFVRLGEGFRELEKLEPAPYPRAVVRSATTVRPTSR